MPLLDSFGMKLAEKHVEERPRRLLKRGLQADHVLEAPSLAGGGLHPQQLFQRQLVSCRHTSRVHNMARPSAAAQWKAV